MSGLYTRTCVPDKASATGRTEPPCYPPYVTRPRTSAPGPERPARLRSPSIPVLLPFVAALAMVASACGSAQGTQAPSPSPAAGSVQPAASDGGSAAPTTTDLSTDGAATEAPEATEAPAESAEAALETATPAVIASASDCTGTDENWTFYESVAAAVDWTVYCPVLPSGWFVEAGQYRLAGGGRLAITYRGPGGARFTLDEGAWCQDESGCTPSGADSGAAAFGDREGTLVATDTGDFAIAVDAGSKISWQLAGTTLDEPAVRMFGAALIAVGG